MALEGIEELKTLIQATQLGNLVSYYTDLELDSVVKRVKVVGQLKGKYFIPPFITVAPKSVTILAKGEEELYQRELPKTIDSILEEINGYTVLRED